MIYYNNVEHNKFDTLFTYDVQRSCQEFGAYWKEKKRLGKMKQTDF